MMTPTRRRLGPWLAALSLTAVMASGCTAGAWRYDAPPAAGVQQDAGVIKARNLLVVADASGTGVLLGTLVSAQPVELTAGMLAAEPTGGAKPEPVTLSAKGQIPAGGALNLQAKKILAKNAGLVPGQLARVALQFSDGTQIVLDTPVVSAEHSDYAQAFKDAQN